MRNNRLKIAGLFLLLLAVIVGVWYVLQPNSGTESVLTENLPEALEPYTEQIAEIEKLQQQDAQQAQKKSEALIEQLPSPVKKWFDLAVNAGIEDIKFYGKVVDQHGSPLAGAVVHYDAAGKFYGTGSGFGYVSSDDSGHFFIDVHGGSLNIRGIEYPDAMHVAALEDRNQGRKYAGGNLFWGYIKTKGSENLVWSDYSAENPFVFDLWVINREEADYYKKHITGRSDRIEIAHDGRFYTVKLGRGTTRAREDRAQVREGVSNDGDIIVSCERDVMQQTGEYGDWRITLQVVNGGIQKTTDRYLNQAPETGYLPSIEIIQKLGTEDYRRNMHSQRYYFTAHGGQVYGAFFNSYYPFKMPYDFKEREYKEQYCELELDYKINTGGYPYLFNSPGLLYK